MKTRSAVMLVVVALLVAGQSLQAADKGDKAKAKGKRVAGTVKSVDAASNSITLTVKVKKETEDKTFKVATDAKIKVAGKEGTISDVKAGSKAVLLLSEDGSTVTGINVPKAKKSKDKDNG